MTEPPRTVQSDIDQTPIIRRRTWSSPRVASKDRGKLVISAFAKVGAVLTAFLFPVLLADAGINFLLSVLIASSLLGAWATWQFRIETTGVSLEKIGR